MPASPEAKARARDLRLQRTYGITQAQYEELREHQDGLCAICEKPPRGKLPLNVDHDHKTGVVRGLLCWSCNHRVLPALRDNAHRAENAARYLMHPPAQDVFGLIIAPPKPKRKRRKRTTTTTTRRKTLG